MSEYIERETAIAWFMPYAHAEESIDADVVISDIKGMKAADVAPVRHARWGVEVGMNFFKERNCPVCKKRIESNFWNYCPNCGAKMDGGNEGE